MSDKQLGIPKGTRDFGPETMAKRHYILLHIRSTFEKYGFQPLETPSMEQLSVLTGKYGEEGDQLLFKILNSGDYLKKTTVEDFQAGAHNLLTKVSEKGLRYDLTVPFARYVVMHRNEITFPFKRYQMQPVWRADRPQRGRYREFFQCDADVVGTGSLLCEAEIVAMITEVFAALSIKDYSILINHRQILAGIAEAIGASGKESELAVAMDKLAKIGVENVLKELASKGFEESSLNQLLPILSKSIQWNMTDNPLEQYLSGSLAGNKGIQDLKRMFQYLEDLKLSSSQVVIDATLARGLSYYTGTIFEVVVNNADMGSVCGGGRYDDLTGIFGLPDVSGVGISFGVDRIYDVMEQLDLFPVDQLRFTDVLLISLDESCDGYALSILSKLRSNNIASELYPDKGKLKKPMGYAHKKGIPWVVLIGSEEMSSGKLSVKNMIQGSQDHYTEEDLIKFLASS